MKQTIDNAASNIKVVSDKHIKHLASKAAHFDKDPYTGHKIAGTERETLVGIPKTIRRKMQKSSSTKIPDRFTVIDHDKPSLMSTIAVSNDGNKAKGLNKGEYKIDRKNTPKQIRAQNQSNRIQQKKG